MTINIVDWDQKLSSANLDKDVGIAIAALLEANGHGTYITILAPGASVNPHYHKQGDEEYHIISGCGIIRLLPLQAEAASETWITKTLKSKNSFIIPSNTVHQLINTGNEPLTLIFSCPISHLKEDRFVIENSGRESYGKRNEN